MSLVLNAEPRTERGKAAAGRIRRKKLVPGVCYGKGVTPFHLNIEPDALTRILSSPKGRNTVFKLEFGGTSHDVMVQSVQRDPIKRSMVHVDFLVVNEDDSIVVEIPIRTVGKSVGEKAGGRLVTVRRTVDLRCKVSEIPECIEYDVSPLDVGHSVMASQLAPPPGSEVTFRTDFVVLSVVLPKGKGAGGEEEGPATEAAPAKPAAEG